MRTVVSRRSFLREESGISLTEGLIAFPIVMLVFAAFIEFGYAMFQWNQTVKALQLGARVAAVSDWMIDDVDRNVLFPANPSVELVGSGIPSDGLSRTCSTDSGAAQCIAGLNRLVNGSGRWPGLASFNPRIGLDNVVVTYERSGLGYYGRPGGAVVTIRVESRRVTFDLPIIGALLGLDDVTIPAMPVTITSEDMNSGV